MWTASRHEGRRRSVIRSARSPIRCVNGSGRHGREALTFPRARNLGVPRVKTAFDTPRSFATGVVADKNVIAAQDDNLVFLEL